MNHHENLAYIALSYPERNSFIPVFSALSEILNQRGFCPLTMVYDESLSNVSPRELMKASFQAIDNAVFVIAEGSTKGIGIGIEAGYAHARKKKIIYCHDSHRLSSITMEGTCDFNVIYEDIDDLKTKVSEILDQHF